MKNQQITISSPKLRLDTSGLPDQNWEFRVFRLQILVIILNESSVKKIHKNNKKKNIIKQMDSEN